MRTLAIAACGIALVSSGSAAQTSVRVEPRGNVWSIVTQDADRPMIGVSTRSSGRRDTLGLLVESVTRDGPADKAGIEEGDRLVSVNDVNLRLSPQDAGEPDMAGIATRRLTRELGRHEPGDTVELRVWRDGRTRSVRVPTVSAQALNEELFGRLASAVNRNRAVLGISLGGSGSERDTLGILIVGVTNESPADSAGIGEGDRIAGINGVDLRVAREDAGDWQATNARIRRLQREMEKVDPGTTVELRVWSNGQMRTMRVQAVRVSELRNATGAFFYSDGPGGVINSLRMIAPRIDVAPEVRRRVESEAAERVRRSLEDARVRTTQTQRRIYDLQRRAAEEARARAAAGQERAAELTRAARARMRHVF